MGFTIFGYEPPLSQVGEPIDPLNPTYLTDGVTGYAVEHDGEIWIPEIEGSGDGKVGVFLDSLSPRCCIVNVISPRLEGMLIRRGWKKEYDYGSGERVDIWRRK